MPASIPPPIPPSPPPSTRRRRSFFVPLGILAFLHVYIGLRLLPDLGLGPAGYAAAVAVLVLSYCAIPVGFMARTLRLGRAKDAVVGAALFMMGFFSSLFVFTLLRDVVLLVAMPFVSLQGAEALSPPTARMVVALAVFASLVGLFNARRLARIVDVDIPLANLPESLHGFTIAQITDVHVGPTIKRNYVAAIVEAVNNLEPDLIALTGDLVDGSVRDLAAHTEPFSQLRARHGVYFVTGNHEYYSGERDWTAEFSRLGLRVLMNEHVVITQGGERLVVAGVADYSAHHFNPAQRSDPERALQGAPTDVAARILLAHQPRSSASASAAGFDLQLSGHTHGGQFWPWNLFVRLQQPFTAGLHRLGNLWVYISRGTGYWGPPKRFGSPSEITRLRLVPAPSPR
jgi:predicted MPP superfamily phosphohydrolase